MKTRFFRRKLRKSEFLIDISRLENEYKTKSHLKSPLHQSALRLFLSQGTPYTKLIETEELEENETIKQLSLKWLQEALARLPINQNVVLCHRFSLEESGRKKTLKLTPQRTIAKDLGVSQRTVCIQIKQGLSALKKDAKKNLIPKIKRLKS